MLVYFTDAVSKEKIAINPKYVVVVFVARDGEVQGKTIIGVTTGNIIVDESQLDVVGALQSQVQ